MFMVARIDGRSFTRLTKEGPVELERPFDTGLDAVWITRRPECRPSSAGGVA